MKEEKILDSIMDGIARGVSSDFTGLGIILVKDGLDTLPTAALLDEETYLEKYKTEEEIIKFLINISHVADKRHDGFHIISQKLGLIKICQYVSPEIPRDFKGTIFNVGSRYRAAQYGSLYENVCSIIIVSHSGVMSVARNGTVEPIE